MGLRNINIKDKAFKMLDDMTHQPRLKLCIVGYGTIGKIITKLVDGHEVLVVEGRSIIPNKSYTDRVIKESVDTSFISLVDNPDPINYHHYDAIIICPLENHHINPMVNQLKSIHYKGLINIIIPSIELNNTPMDYIIPFSCDLVQMTSDQLFDPTNKIGIDGNGFPSLVNKIINSIEVKYDGVQNDY